MVKIAKVVGREIFDSRLLPTLECHIILEDGRSVIHSVPAGVSRGGYEAYELRDGGTRFAGMGVLKAIDIIDSKIAPTLVGKEPDLVTADLCLRELDGSPEKMYLGANTLYAVSGAVAKAQAYVEEIELFELFAHLVDLESVTIPFPLFNALSGGKHAPFTGLAFQEFLVIPVGMSSYRACLESAVTFFHYLAYVLNEHASAYTISEEGGFAAIVADEQAALDLLVMTAQYASQENNVQYVFALDVAATHLYDAEKKVYTWNGHTKTTQEMIGWYEQLIAKYPIYSIEDGLHEGDREGWQEMSMRIGDQVRLVGDDLCVTQTPRIATALNQHLIDTVIIKPNQVGTLTEALEAIKLARQHEAACMVSHRCADTPDTLIADLAVGTSASHIKAGGLFRSERLEKYLQLVRIEDFLMFSLLN